MNSIEPTLVPDKMQNFIEKLNKGDKKCKNY